MWRLPRPTLVFWPLRILDGVMSLPVTVVALDLGDIFHFFLDGTGVNTRCKGFVATAIFLVPSAPRTFFLVVLILLRVGGRSLLSGKWLFSTRYVSKSSVSGLILSTGVFLLLLSGLVPLGTPWVYVAGTGGGLEYCLCLYVDSFLYGLFQEVQVTASGI